VGLRKQTQLGQTIAHNVSRVYADAILKH